MLRGIWLFRPRAPNRCLAVIYSVVRAVTEDKLALQQTLANLAGADPATVQPKTGRESVASLA
jgi:hypothetical protein